ncbi:hypothetical protein ABZ499_07015 [Streptomyces sp. NPDC019990]
MPRIFAIGGGAGVFSGATRVTVPARPGMGAPGSALGREHPAAQLRL